MQHQKCINVTIFGSSSTPFPPRINVGSCADGRIYASDSQLSFQRWLGGEGGRDQFLTFMWSENSMMRSFFIAFLALKWIQKNFNSWVIVVKIPRFGRVSLWALPYGGDFLTPQMEQLAFYDVLCCFQHFFTLHSTLQQMDFVHLSALKNGKIL